MNDRLARNLDSVRARLSESAMRAGRSEADVCLVAVTKGRGVEEISSLYEMGHRDFGENRAQELAMKAPELPHDITWHFIGPLQTNKVRLVRPVVAFLHSLDRMDLARAWTKGPGAPPPAFLQVNIGREPQKHGFDPADTANAFRQLIGMGVSVVGLTAIPPIAASGDESRPYFRRLAELSAQVRQINPDSKGLSMGMTDDFEVAIEEGATFIRVGRAIFDPTGN